MVVKVDDFKKKINLLGLVIPSGIPISYNMKSIRIDKTGNDVYAYAFDGTNNIKVLIGQTDEPFHAILEYETFAAFIKSCDGDEIQLTIKDDNIAVKAKNVKCKFTSYNISDPTGGIPDPSGNFNYDTVLTDKLDVNIFKTLIDPKCIIDYYRKVYFGESILVTDTNNVIKIDKKVFTDDIVLGLNSIELLNSLTNIQYTFTTHGKLTALCVKSDEAIVSILTDASLTFKYQPTEFFKLYDKFGGVNVTVSIAELRKAYSMSQVFKQVPDIVFNEKGIFIQIVNSEYIYRVSTEKCIDRTFKFTSNLLRRLSILGTENVTLYYESQNFIMCDGDLGKAILAVEEIDPKYQQVKG